jgi:hypothetical protein
VYIESLLKPKLLNPLEHALQLALPKLYQGIAGNMEVNGLPLKCWHFLQHTGHLILTTKG